MVSRRASMLSLVLAAGLVAGLIGAAACNDSSNMVTAPAGPSSVNVSGTWTGTFSSAAGCSAVPMTATLTQTGNRVTGTVITSNCGLSSGYLKASLDGHQLTGTIGMMGCTGGAVNGTVNANSSQIAFSMGDLTKPLVTGDQVIAPGGDATLTK